MHKLRLVFILMFGIFSSSHAQTNSAVLSLVDTPPINGQGDSVESGFMVGELINAPLSGLFPSELLIPLPAMPTNSRLTSAVLSLNFSGSSGTNGNSTFGSLSVYYSFSHNTLTFDTADYSASDFVLVTNAFLRPNSPSAIYNMDVTPQVASNYAMSSAPQFLALRFQVDGLQYQGGNHYYQFINFERDYPFPQSPEFYPAQLTLQFSQLSSPSISCILNQNLGLFFLHWPVTASNYVLVSAHTLRLLRIDGQRIG